MSLTIRFIVILAFLLSCGTSIAAPQDYVFTVRNGGVPSSGLATTLTSSEVAYNSTTEAAVSSGLPSVHEYGSTARYVVHYDAVANPPLVLMFDAGSSFADPNERYFELFLVPDPAILASLPSSISAIPGATATSVWSAVTRTLTAQADSPGVGTILTRLGTPTGASIDADILTRLATSGYVTPPTATTIAAAVANYNAGGTAGTLSLRVADAIAASINGGSYLSGTINTSTHQQTVVYYLPGTTLSAMNAGTATIIDTALVTYDPTNTRIVNRVDTPGSF